MKKYKNKIRPKLNNYELHDKINGWEYYHAIKIASERMMIIKAEPYLFPQLKDDIHNIKYNFYTKEIIKS